MVVAEKKLGLKEALPGRRKGMQRAVVACQQ
jgi:hypothetical protein